MEMFTDKRKTTGNSRLTKTEQIQEEYIHRLQKDVDNLNETIESEISSRRGKEKILLSKQIECLQLEDINDSLNTLVNDKSKENDELKEKLKRMEDRVNTVEKEKLELHELVGFEKENTVILEKRFHDLEMQHKGIIEDYKEQQETMTTIMRMSKKSHSKVRKTIDCPENARKDQDIAMAELLLNKRQDTENRRCLTSEGNENSKIKRLQKMFQNHEEKQQSPPDESTKGAAIVVNAQYFINKT